jgi:hypothetical protein
VLAAVPRQCPRRVDPGTGRRRQDAPRHRTRTHSRSPPAHRTLRPRPPDVPLPQGSRPDNSVEAEMRALARVEVLILDDLALQAMDATQTSDFLRADRRAAPQDQHHRHQQPRPQRVDRGHERPAARPIRGRPARLHQLRARHRRRVLPPSATPHPAPRRRRHRLTQRGEPMTISAQPRWSLGLGKPMFPSRWQATTDRERPLEITASRC